MVGMECAMDLLNTPIDVPIGRSAKGYRSFPVAFRIEFLQRWDLAVQRGAKTRLMREYSLTRGTVREWLQARESGAFSDSMVAAAEKSRDRMDSRDRAELAKLRAKVAALEKKNNQSEAALEIMGKAFELLEGITESSTEDEGPQIPPALMSAEQYQVWLKRHGLS